MMAYGAVDRRIWNDERFRSWDRDTRDTWIYLLTTPHGNRLGCFVLPAYYVADHVQIGVEAARDALQNLHDEERIVWDPDLRVVCIRNHLHPDYNPLANPNVVTAALKDLSELPDSEPCLQELLSAVRRWGKGHYEPLEDVLAERVTGTVCETVTETVTETVSTSHDSGDSNGSGNGSGNGMANGMRNPEPEHEPYQDPDPEPEQEPEEGNTGAVVAGRNLESEPEVKASDLVAAWVDRQPPGTSGPSGKEKSKQGAAAKRICENHPRERIAAAWVGMDQLFPHSDGEPWDLFDLERKFSKACEAAMEHPEAKDQLRKAEMMAALEKAG